MQTLFALVPNVPVGNAYASIGGNEMSVLIGSDVCIPKLELGNEEIESVSKRRNREMQKLFALVPNVPVGNAYASIGGNEMSVLIGSDVCIPKLELGNEE